MVCFSSQSINMGFAKWVFRERQDLLNTGKEGEDKDIGGATTLMMRMWEDVFLSTKEEAYWLSQSTYSKATENRKWRECPMEVNMDGLISIFPLPRILFLHILGLLKLQCIL